MVGEDQCMPGSYIGRSLKKRFKRRPELGRLGIDDQTGLKKGRKEAQELPKVHRGSTEDGVN